MNSKKFRDILITRGYTIRSFAKAAGIPESTLYKYAIANRNPSISTANHISNVLDLTDEEFKVVFRSGETNCKTDVFC